MKTLKANARSAGALASTSRKRTQRLFIPEMAETTRTQAQKARELRTRLQCFFPEMAEIKDKLGRVLDAAQNQPPQGGSDGSIDETQWNQLKVIHKALDVLLVAQLFDTQETRR